MQRFLLTLLLAASTAAHAEQIGSVDTAFVLIGPDHKIVVEAYDDPGVNGVTCYVSRAKTGGVKGALGLAEDKSEASIACRQVGPISILKPLPEQEDRGMYNYKLQIWIPQKGLPVLHKPVLRMKPIVF